MVYQQESIRSPKDMYKNLHFSIMRNNPKLKTNQMPSINAAMGEYCIEMNTLKVRMT